MPYSSKNAVREFLFAWIQKDQKSMFNLSQLSWRKGNSKKKLKKLFEKGSLIGYHVLTITQISNVFCKYRLSLEYASGKRKIVEMSLICESAPGVASSSGSWGVVPGSLMRKAS